MDGHMPNKTVVFDRHLTEDEWVTWKSIVIRRRTSIGERLAHLIRQDINSNKEEQGVGHV